VDILLDEDIVDRYYGDDGKDLVHLGRLIKNDKYKESINDKFLGRVLRISKSKFKQMNGFPNTFYGWGGEDDALLHRIEQSVVYRPIESATGIEMETTNDIFTEKKKDDVRVEANKIEQIILDAIQWKIDGVNSLQYAIEDNTVINDRVRKIRVQLNPSQHLPMVLPSVRVTPSDEAVTYGGAEVETEPIQETVIDLDEPIEEDSNLEILDGMETLNKEAEEKKIEYS
jgi:hypothetical protein